MGNFSRDTFVPDRNYVAMRVQQGVPLLDSDLNELHDIARHELYEALRIALPDGVRPSFPGDVLRDFRIDLLDSGPNDFQLLPGLGLIGGRPVHVHSIITYSTQPWTDPARAAADGVPVIPPLTSPPVGGRDDLVYLDVWEREVDSAEDPNLVNPAVAVETSVRLRREVTVRVLEGGTILPGPPDGHGFLPVALLHRAGPQIALNEVEEIKPPLSTTRGRRIQALPLVFGRLSSLGEWSLAESMVAVKDPGVDAAGVLALALPDGARLLTLRVAAFVLDVGTPLRLDVMRIPRFGDLQVLLSEEIVPPPLISMRTSSFDTHNRLNVVDNDRYAYVLVARSAGASQASIRSITISYEF